MSVLKLDFIFAIGVTLVLLTCNAAKADIYRYKDEKGIWHFSNIKFNKNYQVYLREKTQKSLRFEKKDLKKFDEIIFLASRQFQVEESLIRAVIKAESDFDHRAVSQKGAKGLMQLMPNTMTDLDVRNPFDPKENILGGTRYLSLLLKRFNNNKTLALAAYNAGPSEVEARNGIPPFPETKTFVKRVMNYYQSYNGQSY